MRNDMTEVYLGLGSNLGDREANICRAARELRREGLLPAGASSIYESEPVGVVDQPLFLNAVLRFLTRQEPRRLLQTVKGIETRLGRLPGPRWGPRLIDIDILLYGARSIAEEGLVIPHPSMRERSFVLIPLQEIAPEVNIGEGLCLREAVAALSDLPGIRLFGPWRCDDAE